MRGIPSTGDSHFCFDSISTRSILRNARHNAPGSDPGGQSDKKTALQERCDFRQIAGFLREVYWGDDIHNIKMN